MPFTIKKVGDDRCTSRSVSLFLSLCLSVFLFAALFRSLSFFLNICIFSHLCLLFVFCLQSIQSICHQSFCMYLCLLSLSFCLHLSLSLSFSMSVHLYLLFVSLSICISVYYVFCLSDFSLSVYFSNIPPSFYFHLSLCLSFPPFLFSFFPTFLILKEECDVVVGGANLAARMT